MDVDSKVIKWEEYHLKCASCHDSHSPNRFMIVVWTEGIG